MTGGRSCRILGTGLFLAAKVPGFTRGLAAACRRLDVSAFYHTPVGVKVVNPAFTSEMLEYPLFDKPLVEEKTDALLLAVDGLMDRYTLLGTAIGDSPHMSLVRALHAGEDIAANAYVRRASAGTLDRRPRHPITPHFLAYLQRSFASQIAAVESGSALPIKVLRVAGRYYIADGKHRAAVHHLLGRNVLLQDVTVALYDSFFRWFRRKMQTRPSQFREHLLFYEHADRAVRVKDIG